MRRVFLTGATGFVGATVLRRMVSQQRTVAVLLREASDARRIRDLLPLVTVVRGDLARLDGCRDAIAAFRPDCVMHLAWQGVRGSDRNHPLQLENVSAAVALYKLASRLGCSRIVGMGSQAEYGPHEGRISEDTPPRPTTLYGAAKLATCILLERASAIGGQTFAWLRLFSSYGPDDDPDWMIPYLVSTLLAGSRPSLTAAEQLWDYIHVEDAAAAVVAMADADACGVFNLGSGTARPLREIVTAVRDAIDPSLPLGFGEVPYRTDQVMHLEADISALQRATGWAPVIDLAVGLRGLVDYHRQKMLTPDPVGSAAQQVRSFIR